MNILLSPLTLSFVLATTEIGLAVILLFNSRDRTTRIFTLIVFFHVIWMLSHGILHSFSYSDFEKFFYSFDMSFPFSTLSFVAFLINLNYIIVGIISTLFFYFSFTYKKTKKTLLPFVGIVLSQLILLLLYKSGGIVSNASFSKIFNHWTWSYGSLYIAFDLFLIIFWVLGFYFLSKKNLEENKKSNKTPFLFWSLFLSVSLFLFVEIALPQMGYFTLDWASPATGILWIILLVYIIIKTKKVSVDIFFIQSLLFSVSFFLISNILIVGFKQDVRTVFETIIKTSVLISFVSVGRLLVSNIFKESERKKKVENLNSQLKSLNEDLGGKVAERTKELAKAKIHSETILENLTLGIVEYDNDFTILRVNKTAEQFLGIDRHLVVGKILKPKDKENKALTSFASVLYPALSKEGHKVDSKEEFEQDISKNEIVINHPKKRELQIMTVPLKGLYATEKPRFVKLIRDVTHENMVDRSKSEFIKIAAHQLRTPLSGTKWALRATLDRDLGEISKKQEEILQKAYNANKSLIDIVNDFLNVTKIEGGSTYENQKNDITEVIKEAILSSMLLAKDKKIKITFKKTKTKIPLFAFDKIKILLAIKNVVGNAIDYTPNNGEIIITLKKDDNNLFITTTDNGMGISDKDIKKIFTKFYRTEQAQKVVPYRSGLGLYITKEVIEKHGGKISIESKEGKGTSVTIVLPLK